MRFLLKKGLVLVAILAAITFNYGAEDTDRDQIEMARFNRDFAECFQAIKSAAPNSNLEPPFLSDISLREGRSLFQKYIYNKKALTQEEKDRVLLQNYFNSATGWTQLKIGASLCLLMWVWNIFSYYSQYFSISQEQNSDHNSGQNESLAGPLSNYSTNISTKMARYPSISPASASLTVTSTIYTLNQLIAYKNIVLINNEGIVANMAPVSLAIFAVCLLPVVHTWDTQHILTAAVYSLFGGIAFILINDCTKYFSGVTTLPNPLKNIPSKQFENAQKLLQKLRLENNLGTRSVSEQYKEITKYLIKELG